jgi:hypothetical protein
MLILKYWSDTGGDFLYFRKRSSGPLLIARCFTISPVVHWHSRMCTITQT